MLQISDKIVRKYSAHMQNTYLIWIPSIQKNIRFKELTCDQYRIILKNLDDDTDLDFLYNLNEIIRHNIIDVFDYTQFTIIDRFVIFLYFKILSSSPLLDLSKACEKCGKEDKIRINLNDLLDVLGPVIDRSFIQLVEYDNYPISIICDVPTIYDEYNNLLFCANYNIKTDTLENNIEKYLFGYIKQLRYAGSLIELDKLTIQEKRVAVGKLPANMILKIRQEYLEPIFEQFKEVVFLDMKCKECDAPFELKLETNNINPLLKMFFRDNTLYNLLGEYFNIASVSHISNEFFNTCSPKELEVLHEFAKSTHTSNNKPANNPQEIDLFAQ